MYIASVVSELSSLLDGNTRHCESIALQFRARKDNTLFDSDRLGDPLYSTVVLCPVIAVDVMGQCSTDYYGGGEPLELQASPHMSGNIYSPNYPSLYDDDAHCRWSLTTYDPGYVIRLTVMDIELEESFSENCPYDYVQVFDGRTSYQRDSPLLKKFCSDDVYKIYSSGRYMFIEFKSDSSISHKGFHFSFQAVHRSQVPSTTSARPTTTTSHYDEGWHSSINTGALIGGLVGGMLVLFVFCALCRYYMRSNQTSRMARTTYLGPPATTTTSAAASQFSSPHTIYQNNNAVFMMTQPANGSAPAIYHPGAYAGVTNLAYSSAGDAPPSYFSVQHSSTTSIVQPGVISPSAPPPAAPPPTYTEAMKLSHPPSTPTPE
ncbi:hypothetical protein BaRGS_00001769 [Batillaria attramentaria]|uniref:CUB domain-containing protein n=1 Tax=Batillaria attramentaria TaxID=370345 RepID=A0ABD0M586_9CAEN